MLCRSRTGGLGASPVGMAATPRTCQRYERAEPALAALHAISASFDLVCSGFRRTASALSRSVRATAHLRMLLTRSLLCLRPQAHPCHDSPPPSLLCTFACLRQNGSNKMSTRHKVDTYASAAAVQGKRYPHTHAPKHVTPPAQYPPYRTSSTALSSLLPSFKNFAWSSNNAFFKLFFAHSSGDR